MESAREASVTNTAPQEQEKSTPGIQEEQGQPSSGRDKESAGGEVPDSPGKSRLSTMRDVLLERNSRQEVQELKELKLQKSLEDAQTAIKLVQQNLEEMPLTIDFAKTLMGDFLLRNRIVRQAIVYQVLSYLGLGIKVFSGTSYKEKFSDAFVQTPGGRTLRVGIIGGGVMGKTVFEAIHKKEILGRPSLHPGTMIDAEISTRVPEKLAIDMLNDIRVHSDNSRCLRECSVIILCIPKHKLRNVLNDIREDYSASLPTNVKPLVNSRGN